MSSILNNSNTSTIVESKGGKNMSHKSKQVFGFGVHRSGLLCRRGSRKRIAPVEYWNGASVKYDDDGTLIGVERVEVATETRYRKLTKKSNKRHSDPLPAKPSKKYKRPSDIELKRLCNSPVSCKRKRSSDIDFSDSIISTYNPNKKRKIINDIEFSDSIISGPQHDDTTLKFNDSIINGYQLEASLLSKGQMIIVDGTDDTTVKFSDSISIWSQCEASLPSKRHHTFTEDTDEITLKFSKSQLHISLLSKCKDNLAEYTDDITLKFSDSIISGQQSEASIQSNGQLISVEDTDVVKFCIGAEISDIAVDHTTGHRRETVFGAISMEMTCLQETYH